MSVTVYKALKHRILAGKKIYHNNTWKTLPDNAKMYLNGAWHKIGSGVAENAVSIPTDPEQSVTHDNGSEPSTGTKWYITPNGSGNMDGSSWANAASGSMIHVILLSASSGDSVYFSEGDYTTDRTISLPAGVNLYGGFDADTPAWSTRNGFTRQTVFTGSNTFLWMDGNAATSGQKVDGFVIKNYSNTITSGNVTLRNSIVNLGTTTLQKANHCVFISVYASVINMEYCNFFYGDTYVTTADHVNVYGTEASKPIARISGAQYCTAVNCTSGSYGTTKSYIFGENATNCTAVNCTSTNNNTGGNYSVIYYSYIFGENATNCTAVNCNNTNDGGGNSGNIRYSCIFYDSAINCIAVNCSINDSRISNTSCIFGGIATNCTAVNCSIEEGVSGYNNESVFIFNVPSSGGNVSNCLSWNNIGTEYSDYTKSITCAGSTYNSSLALTLGTDNTIARFTNTGYAPAQGAQDIGDCPSPITDPTGFAAWIAAFGDWHPAANSFLIGKGTAVSGVTKDLDGVRRSNPPTIGAYEPKSV